MARDWNDAGGDWNSNTESWEGEADSPAKANLTLTGHIPQRTAGEGMSPDAGSATFVTTYPWDLVSGTWGDASGTWAAPSINVPSVAVGTIITITKGTITFSTVAPTLDIDHFVIPAKGDLTSSFAVPKAGLGTVIIPSVGSMEIISTYSWETYGGTWATATTNWETSPSVPLVTIGLNELPEYTTLTITGFSPEVDIMRLTYVPSASMTTTLYVPYAFSGHMAFPGAGSLDLSPDKIVWDNWVGDWDSATETWDSIVDTRPSVGQTFSFDPSVYDAILSGKKPDAQHRAPKFIPPIQVI